MIAVEFRGVVFPKSALSSLGAYDFRLAAGQCAVIFGRAGAGTSLFVKLAAGFVRPEAGEVLWGKNARLGLPVGYISERGGLINSLTLLENTMLPVLYHGLMPLPEARARARETLAALGIGKFAERRPASVSDTERVLAQFARARLSEPALLVVDQPFNDVDAEASRTIRGLLRKMKTEARSGILLASANLGPTLDLGDRFLLMREGRIDSFDTREALTGSDDPEVRAFFQSELA